MSDLITGPAASLSKDIGWSPGFPFAIGFTLPTGFDISGAWAKVQFSAGGRSSILFEIDESDDGIVFSSGRLDVAIEDEDTYGAVTFSQAWEGYSRLSFSVDIGEAGDAVTPLYRVQGRAEKVPDRGPISGAGSANNFTLNVGGNNITVSVAARGADGEAGPEGAAGAQGEAGAAGADGPNNVTTSTTTNLTGPLHGNGANVAVATAAELRTAAELSPTDRPTFQDFGGFVDGFITGLKINSASGEVRIGGSGGTNSRIRVNGTDIAGLSAGFGFQAVDKIGFSDSAVLAPDTCVSRVSAGVLAVGNGTAGDASGTLTVAQLLGGLVSDSDERGGYVAGGSGIVPEGPNKVQIYLDPSHGGQPQFTLAKAEGSLPNRIILGRSNGIIWRDSAYSDHAGGAQDTGITRDSAGVIAIGDGTSGNADGDVKMRRAHFGSASLGTATLVNGTITVANTSVTANTLIFLQRSTASGTTGELTTTKSIGTSFTINSDSLTDASTVDYLLLELAS